MGQRFLLAFANQGFVPPVMDKGLVTRWSLDGGNWSDRIPIEGQSTKFAPALVDAPGFRIVVAYVANNDTNEILITRRSSLTGGDWTDSVGAGGQRSKTAPAMAVFRDELFMAYVSNDDRNMLMLHSTKNLVEWSKPVFTEQATKFAPALLTWGAELVLAYVDNSDTFELRTMSSTDGVNWTAPRPVEGQSSFAGPALDWYGGGKLIMVYVAANDSHDLLTTTSHDGITWSDSRLVEGQFGAQQANNAPAILGGDPLRMIYTDVGGGLRPTISGDGGINWTNPGVIGAIWGKTGLESCDASDSGVAFSHRWWSDFYWPSTLAFPRDAHRLEQRQNVPDKVE